MAVAALKPADPIFTPIAAQLRERAKTYRAKGYEQTALDLEREADDAEVMANIGREEQPKRLLTIDAALQQWKDGQSPPPRKSEKAPVQLLREKHYKPGTRQPAKKPDVVTGELPWWAKAKPGEMTKAAEQERERMQGSKEAKKVDGGKISE